MNRDPEPVAPAVLPVERGLRISGGGSIAVDTGDMLRAASMLVAARQDLHGAVAGIEAALPGASPVRRAAAGDAVDALRAAMRSCDDVADGLRAAAERYGLVEQAGALALRAEGATRGALEGTAVLLGGPLAAGGVVVAEGGLLGAVVIARRSWEAGHLDPVRAWEDPVVLRYLAQRLSSIDDLLRSATLAEGPADLLLDDPHSYLGTATVAGAVGALGYHPAGDPLSVSPTSEARVRRPRDVDELAARLPDGATPEGQVRVERYDDDGGTRWIVYISGTVTFDRDSGPEPFDMASNLDGVADRDADSQRVVLEAMRQAGVGADEPVLLVGHSQGALDAVRVAQHGGYRVGGVVQFGGPTGQIVLPEDVPVLSFEHDEDLVPILGGAPALGAAGARRLLVRRSLPLGGAAPGLDPNVPAHEMRNYRETARMAEASGDQRIAAFRRDTAGFFTGSDGDAVRYRGDRTAALPVTARPAPNRTGAAG